ncbi:MAG: hypothetical protein J6W00_14350 [Lentisphaeria bacterium]|nr:hypothetical protein [Lentisphaeria bacterium]
MEIIFHIVIWSTPFLVGWNILKKKRPHDTGDCLVAIVLLVPYLFISGFLLMIGNDDMPGYAFINEAFIFHAEKNYGLKTVYDLCQKNIQEAGKEKFYYKTIHQLPFKYCYGYANKESADLAFGMTRGNEGALKIEIKAPDKNFHRTRFENNSDFFVGSWNDNSRFEVNNNVWRRKTQSSFDLMEFLICLFCALCWIFPLAAAAYKAHRRGLFYSLWCIVFALYVMNLLNFYQQTPVLQYEKCNPQTALAEIARSENLPALQKLLQHPTAVWESDKIKTIIDAPLLCSGEFFNTEFLCWDLGKSNYLYYSPTDLVEARLLTKYAKIRQPKENFYLVSYPDFTRASNRIWWQFVIIQTIAGLLWLAMFIMALKKRRQDKNSPEATAK